MALCSQIYDQYIALHDEPLLLQLGRIQRHSRQRYRQAQGQDQGQGGCHLFFPITHIIHSSFFTGFLVLLSVI